MSRIQITNNLVADGDAREWMLFDPSKDKFKKDGSLSNHAVIGYFPSLEMAVKRAFDYETMTSDAEGMLEYREVCKSTLESILKNLGVLPNISVEITNE